jgi:hypothetical protein
MTASRISPLYGSLAELRLMEEPAMLLPGRTQRYREVLEDAYAAYSRIETVIDALGQQLEYEHKRLDEGVRRYGPREVTDEEQ